MVMCKLSQDIITYLHYFKSKYLYFLTRNIGREYDIHISDNDITLRKVCPPDGGRETCPAPAHPDQFSAARSRHRPGHLGPECKGALASINPFIIFIFHVRTRKMAGFRGCKLKIGLEQKV